MALINLETIPVGKLELGMMVHAIGEQEGKLAVKKKGKVSHLSIIDQLSSHGVVSVVIEKNAEPKPNVLHKLNKQKQHLQENKKNKQTSQQQIEETELEIELEFASKLIKHSYQIHTTFTDNIKKQYDLDLAPVTIMALDIYSSLSRNPSALLSLSMLMNSNEYLAGHSIRVAILLCYFAKSMGMLAEDCMRLAVLGYLFDIGMVKVPQNVLNKQGQLSEEDVNAIQQHVNYSLDLLAPLSLDNDIRLAIEQHHERLMGTGYPNGYSGSKIHKFSRMLAIVDCYDALTNDRPHRGPQAATSALRLLSDPANGFDSKLVLKFVRAIGIYPLGSLVLLSNKRIAIVIKNNFGFVNAPVVKVFYSVSSSQYLSPQTVNLSANHNELKVLKPVLADHYNIHADKHLLM